MEAEANPGSGVRSRILITPGGRRFRALPTLSKAGRVHQPVNRSDSRAMGPSFLYITKGWKGILFQTFLSWPRAFNSCRAAVA